MLVADYGSSSESDTASSAPNVAKVSAETTLTAASRVSKPSKKPVLRHKRVARPFASFLDEPIEETVSDAEAGPPRKQSKQVEFKADAAGASTSTLLNMLPAPTNSIAQHKAIPRRKPVRNVAEQQRELIDFDSLGDFDAFESASGSVMATNDDEDTESFINFAPKQRSSDAQNPVKAPSIVTTTLSQSLADPETRVSHSISISAAPETPVFRPPMPSLTDPYPGYYQAQDGTWQQHALEHILEVWPDYQNQSQSSTSELSSRVSTFLPVDAAFQDLNEADRMASHRAQIRPGREETIVPVASESMQMSRGRARGQLTALLKEASSMRVQYEEKIAEGKQNRRAGSNKYGF